MFPVALFAHRRRAHLEQVLGGLRNNGVEEIHAFVDGPRHPNEAEEVNAVATLLGEVTWAKVHLVRRPHNLGLGNSIREGITQVLQKHPTVLVIEDDIVLRPGALAWARSAWKQFANTPNVWTLSLWTDPSLVPAEAPRENGYFSARFVCWGWITGRRAWAHNDALPATMLTRTRSRTTSFSQWGSDLANQAQRAERDNLWYAGFALAHFLHGALSLFPPEPLAVNIGHDGSGENCETKNDDDSAVLVNRPFEFSPSAVWPVPCVKPGLAARYARYFDLGKPGWWDRLKIKWGAFRSRLVSAS
jgi:hypothetical protein